MERSRRQRLSEIYGPPVERSGGDRDSLRQRLAKQQLQYSVKREQRESLRHEPTPPLDQDTSIKVSKLPQRLYHSQSQPLIPTTVLDIGSQRAFVVILFAIIQGYKLYDLILLKSNMPVNSLLGFPNQHFNFITKYLFYDSAFIYTLPALRIPSLTFSKTIVILQIFLLLLINLFIASNLSFPFTTILFTAWKKLNSKDLTILGGTINTEKYDASKHFKGSHTIKILPENTALLNPFQESFCLPFGASNYQTNIPIRLNSTSEIDFIQVKYTDFDTSKSTLLNFTKKDIKKFDTRNINNLYDKDTVFGPNIHYLNLPINKIGLYELVQVLDSKYLGLRNYRSNVIVPYCPSGEISNINGLPKDRCYGDIDKIKFTIQGVPPLKLKYKKLINNSIQEFNDQSLQPEFFESPLITFGSTRYLTQDQLKDLSWAKTQPVEVELENQIKELGDYSYRIEEIVDGLGNLVNYTDSLSSNDELFKKYDLLNSFYVHDSPKIQLNERLNKDSKTKKSLILNVEQGNNASPFEVQIKFISENEKENKIINHVFNDLNDEIPIDKAGIYTLISAKSKYCPVIINGRSSISISLPVVPTLNVINKPITDSCVGQVGLVFDITFTGTPPFTLEQEIFRIGSDNVKKLYESKKLVSQGTRYRYSYEPSTEGSYEISFINLKDSLYQTPIKLAPFSDYTFKTSMRVKPSAEISNHHNSNKALCLGLSGKVPIQFKGEPPFALDYDLIETSTNKRTSYNVKNIKGFNYDIITPEFKVGGEYIISLTTVEDKSSCLVNLHGADAKIKVRREIPSVSFSQFDGSSTIKIKEGDKVGLPIRFLGEGNFEIEYEYLDSNKKLISTAKRQFRSSNKATLEVYQAGYYKLKSIKDSECQGVIDSSSDIYQVIFNPKPSLSVSEHHKVSKVKKNIFNKENICQYHEDSIDLSLVGSPPFVIDYTVVSPDGRKQNKQISVATKFASIRLSNDKSGEYKYLINGIYDSLYAKHDLEKINHSFDQIVVKQLVNPSPIGEFKDKRKSYRTCTTNLLKENSLENINLNISQGKAPYSVTFEIYHESSSKSEFLTLQNIKTNSDLKELYRGLKLGNHIVTIIKIIDSFGCVQDNFSENDYISISISDTPKINQLDTSINYCVGDHISYQLIGTPPFFLVYSFGGITLRAIESSTQFSRYASDSGVISIDSLQDSSSNCVVNFTSLENKELSDKLEIIIHPIPSVEISQGDSIIQDIHEGDQAEIIFSFEGTPPFSLTYVRIEDVDNRRGKKRSQVVETHTVNDIYAYEYRILTNLQGTYEAIEVSDAYCVARNE